MPGPTDDVWEVLATARSIRRFTDEPVGDEVLDRCLEAATWAPNGANVQAWRFVVLRSPEVRAAVAEAARLALEVIEPVYGMSRPDPDDDSRRARTDRATYELHDRAAERTSVLFTTFGYDSASELLLGGSIYPAMQNFLLAARAQGLGACLTSWAKLRRRGAAARGRRHPRGLAAGRPRRRRVAPRRPRPRAPPPPRRRGVPRPLGRRRGPPHRLALTRRGAGHGT
jgi:nitroreductase